MIENSLKFWCHTFIMYTFIHISILIHNIYQKSHYDSFNNPLFLVMSLQ